MREIEFRAKVKYKGVPIVGPHPIQDGEWIYGDLHLRCKYPHIHYGPGLKVPIDPDSIGQYTGLKDKNGKEIYEGDILDLYIPKNNVGKPEHRKRKVIWKDTGFQITNMHNDCVMDRVTSTIKLIYTVIGNIHDNPELIEI